jgi:hypothetical protein
MPARRSLTLALAAAYMAGGVLAGNVLNDPDFAPGAVLSIAVQFGFITLLLNLRGFQARIQQTIVALSGVGLIFGLLSTWLLSRVDVENPQAGLAAAYFGLFFWSLAVDGHIYRHSLSSKMGTGVLVAVAIFTINFMLLRAVFG